MDGIAIINRKKPNGKRLICSSWKVTSASVLTSVCSICCVVFMWISLNKIEQTRKELVTLSRAIHAKNYSTKDQLKDEKIQHESDSKSLEIAVTSDQPVPCKQKDGCSKLQRIFTRNRDATLPLDVPIRQTISAVHFIPIGVTDGSIHVDFNQDVMCAHKWSGVICRNNTYRNIESNQVIEFWQKAPWTRIHSGDVLSLATNATSPGIFRVETGGLYLLYLNVLISATFSKHDVGIFISTDKKLICRENLDYVRASASVSSNPKAKTCSVSGVFYIEQNQTVNVVILTGNTTLYLDSYNTNFGVVMLA